MIELAQCFGAGAVEIVIGKPGSVNCCVPNCTNYYEKTKGSGVSYHSFPKMGVSETQDEWRRKMETAVRRADNHFDQT